jgi:uncharacterized membrane protein
MLGARLFCDALRLVICYLGEARDAEIKRCRRIQNKQSLCRAGAGCECRNASVVMDDSQTWRAHETDH